MTGVVVKVGGSLYDRPDLGPGLRAFVGGLADDRVLVVAGGGGLADAVRDLDYVHQLGPERAHEYALRAIEVTRQLVGEWLGPAAATSRPGFWDKSGPRVRLLSCEPFLRRYEVAIGPVPHTWEVTTDSIAALAARVMGARLVLLKSADVPPGTPWDEAAARGWVDGYFPTAVGDPPLAVEAINFRRWLDARLSAADGGSGGGGVR